jgi:hypothetical protein
MHAVFDLGSVEEDGRDKKTGIGIVKSRELGMNSRNGRANVGVRLYILLPKTFQCCDYFYCMMKQDRVVETNIKKEVLNRKPAQFYL